MVMIMTMIILCVSVFRGSCGGTEALAAAPAWMCCAGETTDFVLSCEVVIVTSIATGHCNKYCHWKRTVGLPGSQFYLKIAKEMWLARISHSHI